MKTLAMPGSGSWFALTVKPRHEKTVAQQLPILGVEAYLPLYRSRRRWSDRLKEVEMCLFPGYVFARFNAEHRAAVLKLPGAVSLVGFGREPAHIPEAEIQAVRDILATGLGVWPWPYLRAGERVRVVRGPLAGLRGILVREKDAWRVVVSVELLQRSVAVEIDREMLAPVRRETPTPRITASEAYGVSVGHG